MGGFQAGKLQGYEPKVWSVCRLDYGMRLFCDVANAYLSAGQLYDAFQKR